MTRKIFINVLFLILPFVAQSALFFDPDESYRIISYDADGGVEQPASGVYPLVYNQNITTSSTRAFWIIKEESSGKYSFRNSFTNQYIRHDPSLRGEKYVTMTDQIVDDYNLFSIKEVKYNAAVCYAVISVGNPTHCFDRRNDAEGSFGTYAKTDYASNNLFLFKDRNGDSPIEFSNNLSDHLASFTLNGNDLIYDKQDELYYFPLLLSQMAGDVSCKVDYEPQNAEYTVAIDEQEIPSGSEYVFKNVAAAKTYTIKVKQTDRVLTEGKIIFSGLPIVQLYTEGNSLSSEFSTGKIRIHEPDKAATGELLNSEMRYRGATALQFNKKSFAIKLKNELGESVDRSYFGLRNDNYWILDAMAMDASRIRNRLCTDIWNDFSSDPYYKQQEPKMINATRGQYVEVFLDDEYWGLYCMTERIDRKQLKLKKYDEANSIINGILYKSIQWSYSVMMGYIPDVGPSPYYNLPLYDNYAEAWDKYEVKYPDLEDGQKIDWEPLYDVVKFIASTSDGNFKNSIAQQVDLPVWADYYLLMELILATDNHGKNGYLYMYDINRERKLGIAPWDMDGVLGIRWDKSKIDANQSYIEYTTEWEHGEHNLFRRLKLNNAADFNELLKRRYDELRFTHFSKENITERIEVYKDIFDKSGAGAREVTRWNGNNYVYLNFDTEFDYLSDWIETRTGYLNNYYGEPISSSVDKNTFSDLEISIYPNPASEYIYITFSNNPVNNFTVSLHDIAGKNMYNKVYNSSLNSSTISVPVGTLTPGIYFVHIQTDSSGKKHTPHKIIIR